MEKARPRLEWSRDRTEKNEKDVAHVLRVDGRAAAILVWHGDFVEREDCHRCITQKESFSASPVLEKAKREAESHVIGAMAASTSDRSSVLAQAVPYGARERPARTSRA